MRKECKSIRALLSPYLDNEISASERAALELHLQKCGKCREELQKIEKSIKAVNNLPRMKAPEACAEYVLQELGTEPESTDCNTTVIRLWPRVMAVAASFLLISATTLLLTTARPRPVAPQLSESVVKSPDALYDRDTGAEAVKRYAMPSPPKDTAEEEQEVMRGRMAALMSEPASGEHPGKDIRLNERPTLENLGKLIDMLRPAGAENVKIAVDTRKEHAKFELHFVVRPEKYDSLYAELKDEFDLELETSGLMLGDIAKSRVAPPERRQLADSPVRRVEEESVGVDRKEGGRIPVNITIRIDDDREKN